MGAQRDFNIKKMVIKKVAIEGDGRTVFACEFETYQGKIFTAYAGRNDAGYWFGAEAEIEKVAERLATSPSYGG